MIGMLTYIEQAEYWLYTTGNYLGGEALDLATELMLSVAWSDAIQSADSPTIYPVVDGAAGEFSGNIRLWLTIRGPLY